MLQPMCLLIERSNTSRFGITFRISAGKKKEKKTRIGNCLEYIQMNPRKIQHHDKQEEVGWVCLYVWFRLTKFLFYLKNTAKQRLNRNQENQ